MTVDRCSHFGELPVEARLAQGRVDRTERPLCGGLGGHEALVLLARYGMCADEALGAGMVSLGELEIGDAATALRDQALDLSLKRAWIDLEEQLTLLYARAVLEGDPVYIAADPRADLHGIHSLQASSKLLPFAQRLVNHLGDHNLGAGCIGSGERLTFAVSGGGKHHDCRERGEASGELRYVATCEFLE